MFNRIFLGYLAFSSWWCCVTLAFFFFLARGFGGEGGTLTTYLLLNTDYLTTYLFTYLPMLP